MIAIGSYYVDSQFGLSFLGSIVYLAYFFAGYWMRSGKEGGKSENSGEEGISVR